jgi:hypothetical protein
LFELAARGLLVDAGEVFPALVDGKLSPPPPTHFLDLDRTPL